MMSHQSKYVKPGADFQTMAMAFLNAISLSRSTLCAFLKRSVADRPVESAEEFIRRIEEVKRAPGLKPHLANCYDGFGSEAYENGVESIIWQCKPPHAAVANGCFTSTVIALQRKNGLWEVSVSGRDEKTVAPRLEAADGMRAVTVPAKILAAVNGY